MLLTAIVFFIILSILIFVHEFGHYSVAKWIGVRVDEFGFGLPPRIWGKKIGETIYSINWLPFGGFVRLAGEDEEPTDSDRKQVASSKMRFFWARSKKERAAILLAGVTMNFLLAVGITTYLLNQGVYEPSGRVHVETVTDNSPAKAAGLQKNDIIVSADPYPIVGTAISKPLHTPADLIAVTNANKGREVLFVVDRNGSRTSVVIVPRVEYPKNQGPLGISISDLELKSYPLSQAPIESVRLNVKRAGEMFTGLWDVVVRLSQRKPVGDDVAGPIGIAKVTGEAVRFGFRAVLEFMSILSLNLAVLNILPIPALDGGRLLFVVLEKFMGRKIKPAFEHSTHQIGMIILLILIVLISINDVMRLARGG